MDAVWRYVQNGEEHNRTHNGRNYQTRPIGENTTEASWEQDLMGRPVKVKIRTTALQPIGTAIEMVEGPMAGSKAFNYYTPRGDRTEVTVVGEFVSNVIPPAELESSVRGFLDQLYTEDAAAIKRLAGRT